MHVLYSLLSAVLFGVGIGANAASPTALQPLDRSEFCAKVEACPIIQVAMTDLESKGWAHGFFALGPGGEAMVYLTMSAGGAPSMLRFESVGSGTLELLPANLPYGQLMIDGRGAPHIISSDSKHTLIDGVWTAEPLGLQPGTRVSRVVATETGFAALLLSGGYEPAQLGVWSRGAWKISDLGTTQASPGALALDSRGQPIVAMTHSRLDVPGTSTTDPELSGAFFARDGDGRELVLTGPHNGNAYNSHVAQLGLDDPSALVGLFHRA